MTFSRRNSEKQERLYPHAGAQKRRPAMGSRKRALSATPAAVPTYRVIPRRSAPDVRALAYESYLRESTNGWTDTSGKLDHQNIGNHASDALDTFWPAPNPPLSYNDQLSDLESLSDNPANDPRFREELEKKWILNLSMHFRDETNREKFFITYAEEPTKWRRVTISCDYRNASEGSLESDLKTLHFQRDKSARIYEALWESLPDIEFYETVTNLKLETSDDRLHVHVTEDVNEIIKYPPVSAIQHLDCVKYLERDVRFESHLSGFVYRISVHDQICIKKEIPSPDTVDEFLYEVNALRALRKSSHVIDFVGVVVDDESEIIKGLLIAFANGGALVDLIFDHKNHPLSWPRRRKWANQIVEGLADIHEHGFVQGDFTLSNIVVDLEDNAKIIDINRRGCPVGWEPPELAGLIESGQRISMYISIKTDLFQLGMVLWALAKLKDEPEREEEPLDFDDADLDVPDLYRDVVMTCLSKAPEERKSAKELLMQLKDLADLDDTSSRVPALLVDSSGNRCRKEYINPAQAIGLDDIEEHKHLHPGHNWDKMSIGDTTYLNSVSRSRSKGGSHISTMAQPQSNAGSEDLCNSSNVPSAFEQPPLICPPEIDPDLSGIEPYQRDSEYLDTSHTRRLVRKDPFELDEKGNIRNDDSDVHFSAKRVFKPPLHQDSGFDEATHNTLDERRTNYHLGLSSANDASYGTNHDAGYVTHPESFTFYDPPFPSSSRLSPDYTIPSYPPALPGTLPRDLAGMGAHTIEDVSSLKQIPSRLSTPVSNVG